MAFVNLTKIQNAIFKRKLLDRKRQEKILDKYNPKDDFDRSYFQYCCQTKCLSFLSKVLLNAGSIFYLLTVRLGIHKKRSIEKTQKDKIYYLINDPANIPEDLRTSFYNVDKEISSVYNAQTAKFIKEINKRYFFHFYFRAKVIKKIAIYEYMFLKYEPTSIYTSNEYSFTSSILTLFCEKQNIENIDIMHGEKIFDIFDSFFRFSKIYAWDESYISLFKSLKASINDYGLYFPKSRFFIEKDMSPKYDLTIYLQEQNQKEMSALKKQLSKTNLLISIRPHPIYTNIKVCKKIFETYNIEDVKKTSITDSLRQTKCVCSLYSTVLLTAHKSNIPFIIDDISMPHKFEILKDLDYPMINSNSKLLSNIK